MNCPFANYLSPLANAPVIRRERSSSSLSLILIVICVIFLFTFVAASSNICLLETIDHVDVPNHRLVESPRERDYKVFKAPSNGTLKLSKGSAKQVHHSIKEDSVIILTRKNIDGKPGQYLVVDKIVPNKYFQILATDESGTLEDGDHSEIYFQVL